MSLELYGHPFSSYCQKVLIALYEAGTPFQFRMLSGDDPEAAAAFAQRWPLKRMPMLVDQGKMIVEASIIVEYLDVHYPGQSRLVPEDRAAALDVRFMDRVFDNYVMTPVQRIVFDALRQDGERDAADVRDARALLETSYDWLDRTLRDRTWAASRTFSLADCAAGPALFHADWVHRIGDKRSTLARTGSAFLIGHRSRVPSTRHGLTGISFRLEIQDGIDRMGDGDQRISISAS